MNAQMPMRTRVPNSRLATTAPRAVRPVHLPWEKWQAISQRTPAARRTSQAIVVATSVVPCVPAERHAEYRGPPHGQPSTEQDEAHRVPRQRMIGHGAERRHDRRPAPEGEAPGFEPDGEREQQQPRERRAQSDLGALYPGTRLGMCRAIRPNDEDNEDERGHR